MDQYKINVNKETVYQKNKNKNSHIKNSHIYLFIYEAFDRVDIVVLGAASENTDEFNKRTIEWTK